MSDRARDGDHVVRQLRALVQARSAQLRAQGLVSLALFDSFARGEATPDSDVDLLYDFERRSSLDALLDLQEAVEEATGRPAQLVSWKHLHPLLRERVLREAVSLL